MALLSSLDSRTEKLRALRAEIPTVAVRFHGVATDLETEIGQVRGRWWLPFVGADRLRQFDGRIEELETTATSLRPFFSEVAEAQKELETLERSARRSDTAMARAWSGPVADWRRELENLGRRVHQPSALEAERRRLAEVLRELQRAVEVADLFGRASELVEELSHHTEAADLSAALDRFRSELEARRPLHEWTEELRGKVEAAETLREQQLQISLERRELKKVMQSARKWSYQLKYREAEHRALGRKVDELPSHQGAAEQEEALRAEARSLLGHLMDKAESVRKAHLNRLSIQIDRLVRYSGAHGDLRRLRDELETQQDASEPEDHVAWLGRADRLEKRLRSEITNRTADLNGMVSREAQDLQGDVKALLQGPLDSEIRRNLQSMQSQLESLVAGHSLSDPFDSLETTDSLRESISQIRQQVETERSALEARRSDLQAELDHLVSCSATAGRSLVASRLAAKIQETPEEELDEAAGRLEGLADELRSMTLGFVESLSQEGGALIDRIRSVEAIFPAESVEDQTGESQNGLVASDQILRVEADLPVEQATQRFLALSQHGDLWDRHLETAGERVLARRGQYVEELKKLDTSSLLANDRDYAKTLIDVLENLDTSALQDPVALQEFDETVRTAGRFVDRLFEEAREVARRKKELREAVRQFKADGLGTYCTRHFKRVEALVEGCPETPRHPARAKRQLDEAGELLAQVRTHAARLAVQEMLDAVDRLRSVQMEASHSTPRDEARALLEQFDDLPNESVPPATLRMQLVQAGRRYSTAR